MSRSAHRVISFFSLLCALFAPATALQPAAPAPASPASGPQRLENIRLRDSCILPDGKLAGPWEQQTEPIYAGGGHAMLFRRFDGQLMITLHAPNNSPLTRQRIFECEDLGDTVRVKKN